MTYTAEAIANWMGGLGKIKVMVGVKSFVYSDDALMFDFKMCKQANKVQIKYNPGPDLYTMVFYKITNRGLDVKKVEEYEEVYGEDLKRFFEEFTGIYLSL